MEYTVTYKGELMMYREPLNPIKDAVKHIHEVCRKEIESNIRWKNMTPKNPENLPEDHWDFGLRFAHWNLYSDIWEAILCDRGEFWDDFKIIIYTDESPIMPVTVSIWVEDCPQDCPHPNPIDYMSMIHDSVEGVKHVLHGFYKGLMEKYPEKNMTLEIRDKNRTLLCGKYNRVDEWVEKEEV